LEMGMQRLTARARDTLSQVVELGIV